MDYDRTISEIEQRKAVNQIKEIIIDKVRNMTTSEVLDLARSLGIQVFPIKDASPIRIDQPIF